MKKSRNLLNNSTVALTPLRGVRDCSRRFAALAVAHSLADQIAVKLRGSLRIFSARIVGRDEYRATDQ